MAPHKRSGVKVFWFVYFLLKWETALLCIFQKGSVSYSENKKSVLQERQRTFLEQRLRADERRVG